MTQEGVNELRNFLQKLVNLQSVLPELQKMADVDSAIKEKTNLLDSLKSRFEVAAKNVADAEDKAKDILALAESRLKEASDTAVETLKKANSQAGQIINEAKNAEAVILARVKTIQEKLAKLG